MLQEFGVKFQLSPLAIICTCWCASCSRGGLVMSSLLIFLSLCVLIRLDGSVGYSHSALAFLYFLSL